MARRPNVTMRKRQREQRKAEKAEEKRAKRAARADAKEGADQEPEEDSELHIEPAPDLQAAAEELTSEPSTSAYCKVCKAVLEHTIVERKVGATKRVKCKTCGDVHAYRKTKPTSRKKARRTRADAADDTYDSLIAGLALSDASPYDMTSVFAEHNLIDHPSFGIGVVARVLPDRKIEVLFPEGARVLAHSR